MSYCHPGTSESLEGQAAQKEAEPWQEAQEPWFEEQAPLRSHRSGLRFPTESQVMLGEGRERGLGMLLCSVRVGFQRVDRAVYEDEVRSVIDVAIRYDGRNVVNLPSLEYICRRKQSFVEVHVLNPSAPSCEAADFFMGSEYPGGAMCQHSFSRLLSRWPRGSLIDKKKDRLNFDIVWQNSIFE